MDSEHYWEKVRKCRQRIQPLLKLAQSFIDQLPGIRDLVDKRDRMTGFHVGQSEVEVKRISESRADLNAQIESFYAEFRLFTAEVRGVFEDLGSVLPVDEVVSLTRDIDPGRVAATCDAVRVAAHRLEEFWEARENPAPSAPAVTENAGSRKKALPKAGPRSISSPCAAARLRTYMEKQGLNLNHLCERMNGGVSAKTLGKFLATGVATASTLDEVAKTLRISKEELLKESV
jgi:hypothetical protein